jgi:hypothetical protein
LKKVVNLFIIIFTSLLTAYKVLTLGLIFISNILSSISIGFIGTKSIMQIFLDFFIGAIFIAVLLYFIKTKQRAMIITSLIGLVSHAGLLVIISKMI